MIILFFQVTRESHSNLLLEISEDSNILDFEKKCQEKKCQIQWVVLWRKTCKNNTLSLKVPFWLKENLGTVKKLKTDVEKFELCVVNFN